MPVGNSWSGLVDLLSGAIYQFGVVSPDSPIHRVRFEPGLTDLEVGAVEDRFGFRFPTDLRSFLQTALPTGPRFPDWRTPSSSALVDQLAWPFEGIAFDIEKSAFWWEPWGPRPAALPDAIAVAKAAVDCAPRLIPVFGHRYLPAEPDLAGNPVFSVYQTDIIHYGVDLERYLLCELPASTTPKPSGANCAAFGSGPTWSRETWPKS